MSTIGDLLVKLGLDSSAFSSGLNKAAQDTEGFGSKIGGIMSGIGKLALGGIVAGITATSAAILKTAADSDALVEMSAKTGIAVEKLQEMRYIGEQVGTSFETMTGSLSFLTRSMAGATDGTGAQATAFKALGITITDSNGEMRNMHDVYAETLSALGGVANETERNALAMQIFGRSAMELNPLIQTTAEEIDNMTKAARASGAIMSESNVRAAAKLKDQMDALKRAITGTVGTLVSGLIPAITEIITRITQGIPIAIEFIRKLVDAFRGNSNEVTALTPIIAALGDVWTGILLPALTAVWTFITNFIIPILKKLWEYIGPLLSTAFNIISSILTGLVVPALAGLVNYLVSTVLPIILRVIDIVGALLVGAFNVVATAIQWVINKIILVHDFLTKLITYIQATIERVLDRLAKLFLGVSNALYNIWTWVLKVINAIKSFVSAIKNLKLPKWLTPGSPTPLELGLIGIGHQLDVLAGKRFSLNAVASIAKPDSNIESLTNTITAQFGTHDKPATAREIAVAVRDAIVSIP